MVFTLSSGEKRIVSNMDYNAFFAMRTIDKANKKMGKAFRQWDSSNELQNTELATFLYNNGVRLSFLNALKENESVVYVHYSICI